MAVYFEPRGKHWTDYIIPALSQLVINPMMQRDQMAQEYKYKDRLATEEAARQAQVNQAARDYISGTTWDRSDPNSAMKNAMMAQTYGLQDMDDLYKNVFPNMERNTVDLGDRQRVDVFDPGTGNITGQDYNVGLSPDTALQEAIKEKVANINAGATLGAAKIRAGAQGQPRDYTVTENAARVRALAAEREGLTRAGRLIPGNEARVAEIDAQIRALNSGGLPGGDQGGVPSNDTEAKISQMMQDTGRPREEVIAWLKEQGMLK